MLLPGERKCLTVENKSFDLICEGRRAEGLRVCENGKGFRVSIFLEKGEVEWLLDALKDFYWSNQVPWANRMSSRNRVFWISFGRNRRGLYLVLSEVLEKKVNKIFIPEGEQGRGWWIFINMAFELAERKMVHSDAFSKSKSKKGEVFCLKGAQTQLWNACFHCPHCSSQIQFEVRVKGEKSYAAALQAGGFTHRRVGQTKPGREAGRTPVHHMCPLSGIMGMPEMMLKGFVLGFPIKRILKGPEVLSQSPQIKEGSLEGRKENG